MATLDSTREELGWLKVVFTIVAAVDVSLVAWVSQAYETARGPLLLIAIVAATLIPPPRCGSISMLIVRFAS